MSDSGESRKESATSDWWLCCRRTHSGSHAWQTWGSASGCVYPRAAALFPNLRRVRFPAGMPAVSVAERYRIELESTLDSDWTEWLGGLTLEHGPDGRTILSGELADQAALHGLLARIRDQGLLILLVTRLRPSRCEELS